MLHFGRFVFFSWCKWPFQSRTLVDKRRVETALRRLPAGKHGHEVGVCIFQSPFSGRYRGYQEVVGKKRVSDVLLRWEVGVRLCQKSWSLWLQGALLRMRCLIHLRRFEDAAEERGLWLWCCFLEWMAAVAVTAGMRVRRVEEELWGPIDTNQRWRSTNQSELNEIATLDNVYIYRFLGTCVVVSQLPFSVFWCFTNRDQAQLFLAQLPWLLHSNSFGAMLKLQALWASLNDAVFHVLATTRMTCKVTMFLYTGYTYVTYMFMWPCQFWYAQYNSTLVVFFLMVIVLYSFNCHLVVFLCAMTALLPTDFNKSFLLKLSECCMTSCSKCRHLLTILAFDALHRCFLFKFRYIFDSCFTFEYEESFVDP